MNRASQLGDTIKDLCSRVSSAEGDELEELMVRLRQALHEHSLEIRKFVVKSYPGVAGKGTKG